MFALLSQLKKCMQAAEQPISYEYFRPRDIFQRWLATACWREQEITTKTRVKHDFFSDKMFGISV